MKHSKNSSTYGLGVGVVGARGSFFLFGDGSGLGCLTGQG